MGRARLLNYRMVCNKLSKDGSGKGNVVFTPGEVVWGVLYEMDRQDLKELDRMERGYERVSLLVIVDGGEVITAETYVSTRLTTDPRPFESYKKRILEGAREHGLPEEYILSLELIPAKPDPTT